LRYRYELIVLDDECKPDTGVQVATKAAADKSIVAGVTHYCSVVAAATVDTLHKPGLPTVVWGAVPPDITYGHKFSLAWESSSQLVTGFPARVGGSATT
jgi:branched-chain amino acid transport system substrate-binding protein